MPGILFLNYPETGINLLTGKLLHWLRCNLIDILLRPGEKALIITGGNAGGKTVCLKTFGLVAASDL